MTPIEVPCDLCCSTDHAVLFDSIPDSENGGEGISLKERYAASSNTLVNERVVRCRGCGLVFISPRAPEGAIHEGYEAADNTLYMSQREGRLQTFRRAARKLAQRTGSQGRLLDVGCAAGYFLQTAQETGWDVEGVEISKHLAESARREFGVTVHQGDLSSAPLQPNSFDVVTFWDVLEHTYTPSKDLAKAFVLLKPGGYLLVNYPAFDSVWAKLLGKRWWFLISVHLTYFTRQTIQAMAAKVGFKPVDYWMHIQKLELDYLLLRLEPYAGPLARVLRALVRTLRLGHVQIPYYASQTSFLAKKP